MIVVAIDLDLVSFNCNDRNQKVVDCREKPAKREHFQAEANCSEKVLNVDLVAELYRVFVHSGLIVIELVFPC